MNIVSITGPTRQQALEQLCAAQSIEGVDALELRVDLLLGVGTEDLRDLIAECRIPSMLTLRTERQGGKFSGDHNAYVAALSELLSLEPDFLDVEVGPDVPEVLLSSPPSHTKFVGSYHDHESYPIFDSFVEKI